MPCWLFWGFWMGSFSQPRSSFDITLWLCCRSHESWSRIGPMFCQCVRIVLVPRKKEPKWPSLQLAVATVARNIEVLTFSFKGDVFVLQKRQKFCNISSWISELIRISALSSKVWRVCQVYALWDRFSLGKDINGSWWDAVISRLKTVLGQVCWVHVSKRSVASAVIAVFRTLDFWNWLNRPCFSQVSDLESDCHP